MTRKQQEQQNDIIGSFAIETFQDDLLYWFERQQRDLPWRQSRDAYRIWVSEIMLQQTRVDTVIPYYERFMERFPTVEKLADAELEEVYKYWEGLGYYSRARNLHSAVKEVKERYGGTVPDTPEDVHALKGVGPYTAGAILSIAYGLPEPAVDGNVMRVLSRIFLIEEDIAKVSTRKVFEAVVRRIIAHRNPSFFNQALMELGALICIPRSPRCGSCPVASHCRAREQGVQEALPVKKKAKQGRVEERGVALVRREDGRWLIHKRPESGLLANLWEFPNVECQGEAEAREKISMHMYGAFGVKCTPQDLVMEHSHVFSHLQWNLHTYICRYEGQDGEQGEAAVKDRMLWVTIDEMENYPFSVSHKKIVEALHEGFQQSLSWSSGQ
ncbi:A/G-specific adenine glycosylase [Aneurinibacillus aneurinilyticus]|uniref:Adenine DNA glycosylase n=1 Tax=Aneurinibacillus aneurinilyticus ATCC 12856 TaxID=649747 RepID=U1Y363_ANEAE|nr:A/G-specific adenine glycosylase [Aneurinibacillus aneurinilyticus]ERI06632.1 A/G-specific adenine glycosylase [Aneurinibacillus aneurinilyticus ATCC 12856]MED0707032.1 A/G-specific adenine glycosylase [Aneurinibacillus aneurinilyticus]MED0723524.1 A/G-specific adenine glycosylase [Aneurinibacillus aneurinilyticus]MED0732899.1 A/G-specific adenine glycosylase [Aneurinibacillus aneurinilyticus]MED0740331.1 A/G-specific adenine glycosylase [Aneurinibacillus aneurinilyticus]